MAVAPTPAPAHWKDKAIAGAAVISDLYEILLAYIGHSSLFIITFCLVVNIMQVIPTLHLDPTFIGVVFTIQAITMDFGGLSLSSMAKHARENGNKKEASVGQWTAYSLIFIMMATVILNYVGQLNKTAQHPNTDLQTFIDGTEFFLLVSRLGISVLYGHVVHTLKDALKKHEQKQADQAAQIAQLQQTRTKEQKEASHAQAQQQAIIDDLRVQLDGVKQAQNATLTTAKEHSTLAADLQNRLQNAERQLQMQSAKTAETTAQLQSTQARLQSTQGDLQTAKATILDLQKQLHNAEKQSRVQPSGSAVTSAKRPAEPLQNITQFDQARAAKESSSQPRAKVSHAEIMAFKAKYPTLKNTDVADKLGCSERKIYEAIAWQKEQETANAVEVAQ